MLLALSEINCTLLKEWLKSGQNYTENQPLGTPEGLISRTRLEKSRWTWNFAGHITQLHMTTLCTNFKRNRQTFISKSAPASQAEALTVHLNILTPGKALLSTLYAIRRIYKLWGANCLNCQVKLNNIRSSMLQIYRRSQQEHFSLKKINRHHRYFSFRFWLDLGGYPIANLKEKITLLMASTLIDENRASKLISVS